MANYRTRRFDLGNVNIDKRGGTVLDDRGTPWTQLVVLNIPASVLGLVMLRIGGTDADPIRLFIPNGQVIDAGAPKGEVLSVILSVDDSLGAGVDNAWGPAGIIVDFALMGPPS